MQSELLNDLLSTVDSKIFNLVLQLILVGAITMWVKDMSGRVTDWFKLKMSDMGRGTFVEIDGYAGYIERIGFDEVEIKVNEHTTVLVPVAKFISSIKAISTHSMVEKEQK